VCESLFKPFGKAMFKFFKMNGSENSSTELTIAQHNVDIYIYIYSLYNFAQHGQHFL
jgi:hypothetical protein